MEKRKICQDKLNGSKHHILIWKLVADRTIYKQTRTCMLFWNALSVALKLLPNGSNSLALPSPLDQKGSFHYFLLTAGFWLQLKSDLTFDLCQNDPGARHVLGMEKTGHLIYSNFVHSLVQQVGQAYLWLSPNATVCLSHAVSFWLLESFHHFSMSRWNLACRQSDFLCLLFSIMCLLGYSKKIFFHF